MRKIILFLALILSAYPSFAQTGVAISGLPNANPNVIQPTDYMPILRSGTTYKAKPYTFPPNGSLILSNGTGVNMTGLVEVDGNCPVGVSGAWKVEPCATGATIFGTPSSGNLAVFASPSALSNTDLTGDVTTSGTVNTTVAKIRSKTVSGTTGTGNVVFSTSPTLVTPALGTPSSGIMSATTALATGGTMASSLALHFAAFANVQADFGAKGDNTTDDSGAIQAAINYLYTTFGGGTAYFPCVANAYYLNSTSLVGAKNVNLVGESKDCVVFTVNAGSPPATMYTAGSGVTEVTITGIQWQVRGSGNIAVQFKGAARDRIYDNYFYSPVSGVGTQIQLDTNSVGGAYNHRVDHNFFNNGNIGIQLLNGENADVIEDNTIISDNAISINGSGGGNIIIGNLLQSRTAGPTGTGINYLGAESNDQLIGNYFDTFVSGITFGSSVTGQMTVIGSHWDGVTTNITDNSTGHIAMGVYLDETGFGKLAGIISTGTKFTASGCSNGTTVGGATAGKFTLGANSCNVVITMNGAIGLTAPNGWACGANDRTAPTVLITETADSTTTATLAIPAGAGTSDVISFSCTGY